LIPRHGLDGFGFQKTIPARGEAAAQDHLHEACVIAGGRIKAAAAVEFFRGAGSVRGCSRIVPSGSR
jgi:hypothetical protein